MPASALRPHPGFLEGLLGEQSLPGDALHHQLPSVASAGRALLQGEEGQGHLGAEALLLLLC